MAASQALTMHCLKQALRLASLLVSYFAFVKSFTQQHAPCQSTNMSLWGHRQEPTKQTFVVALTREQGKNDKLRDALSSMDLSIQIEELPCIAHTDGPDYGLLAEKLQQEEFDYVIITSPEAARVLGSAWSEEMKLNVAAVGKATQQVLENLGIQVAFCPTKATAQTLVEELPAAKSVLYPSSAKAQQTIQQGLAQRGIDVTRLVTYDTVTATWTPEQREVSESVDICCFGSPSAVKGWLQNTNDNKNVIAACIGETSATACRKCDWDENSIYYPDKPGVPGWANAVLDAVQKVVVTHII